MPPQPPRESTADSLPNPVVALDADGSTAYANAAARRLLGDARDLAGAVGAADRAAFDALVANPPSPGPDGVAPAVLLTVRARDGSARVLAWTAARAGDRTVLVASDAGEGAGALAPVPAGALEADAVATPRLARLEPLARSVAGDLEGALEDLFGGGALAASDLDEGRAGRAILGAIATAAVRAVALCDQLRTPGPRAAASAASLDLSQLVAHLAPALRATVGGHATTETALGEDVPRVRADGVLLRQVLVGLVSAASHACGEGGGAVRIATGALAVDPALLDRAFGGRELAPGRYAYLEVSDNGPPFTSDDLERALDPTDPGDDLGRGAVIASVAGAARALGGALSIDAPYGGGTAIRLLVPAEAEGAVADAPGPARDVGAGPQPRRTDARAVSSCAAVAAVPVLVVDDESAVRHVAGRMFERLGYAPLLAAGGVEAVALLARDPAACRLAWIDLTMPPMHGTEVLARLRAIRPDLPVILASGFTGIEAGTEAAAADGCVFLQKPFTLAQLEDAVELALSRAGG